MANDYRDLKPQMVEQHRRDIAEIEEMKAARERETAARLRRERSESAVDRLRDELRAEIDVLRRDCDARYEVQMKAIGEVFGDTGEKILDHCERMISKVENELISLTERRFGELMGRLDGFLPDSPRSKEFKFAGESARDDGPLDLPSHLPPRRRVLDS
jgi:hypothetical protein